jgi:outer membrane receptor for Fe3+-dicitrate
VNIRQKGVTWESENDALRQIPGLKLRETGGVGGSANIMLDGMDSKGENDCTWTLMSANGCKRSQVID